MVSTRANDANQYNDWLNFIFNIVIIINCDGTIVFVGTAGKRTISIADRISVEHKKRGFYKDDRTSDLVDVFSVERGRIKRIKVSSIFLKDMTRNHVENTFSCFD